MKRVLLKLPILIVSVFLFICVLVITIIQAPIALVLTLLKMLHSLTAAGIASLTRESLKIDIEANQTKLNEQLK